MAIPESKPKGIGLAEAIAVAEGGPLPSFGEGEAKLLNIFLYDGECTAEITEQTISVRFSWLKKLKPSTYFISLAPGLVSRLMQLGDVRRIADEATFQVGPGTAGIGRYAFNFEHKWVRIRCDAKRILIWVRDKEEHMNDELKYVDEVVVRCERCNSELRTPLANQCLHCGFDWH